MRCCRGHTLGRLLILLLVEIVVLLVDLADGYAWCREYWNWDGRRRTNDGRRWPAGDGKVITYINGIFHSVPEWEAITHQLQALFGHEVRPFYNPSSGWWITDASKAGFTLLRRPANDSLAKALGDHLAQAVDDVGSKGRVLHIAHSGGALVTYLAAQHHLSKRQRDKIDVLTFGGAVSITRKYFRGRVVNYYSRNDPLVKLDRRAAELMKLTNNTDFQEVYEKHNTTFVYLEGRAGDFVQDHSLEGPTYQYALKKEARAFRRAHFGPLSPLAWDYDMSLLRLTRKKVAEITGVHSFFSAERFGPRAVRKAVALLTGFHGFFSGKEPGSGVQAAIVGDGGKALQDRSVNSTGVYTLVRRIWPWGRKIDDEEPAALLSEDAAPPQDRFWLGLRWGRRDTKTEARRADVNAPLAVDELGMDSGNGESSQSGGWVQLLKAVGLVREQSAAHTGSGGVEVNASLAARADEEQGSLQEARADGEQSLLSVSRPWLTTGWVPWGSPPKAEESSKSTALVTGSSGEAEKGGGGGQNGENEGTAGDATEQEDAEQTSRGDLLLEGMSYLWGWWPTSTSNSSSSITTQETEAAGKENLAKEQSNEDAAFENQEEGHEEGGGGGDAKSVVTATSSKEEISIFRRWLPLAKVQEDGQEVGDVTSAGEEEIGSQADVDGILAKNGATGAAQVERADIALEPIEVPSEPSNSWSLWQTLKEAVTFSSEPYDDAAPNMEEMPISPEAGAGTIADGPGATAGLDGVRGEVVLVEGQIQQDGEPELAGQPFDGSDRSEAGSDALEAGSEEPSNSWSLWQALKEAVTFSSEPYDDAAPNVEDMPISPKAEAGTIADGPGATAGLDDVRGEVVLVEGQIQQDGEPELAGQSFDGSDRSEAGSDALEAGSEEPSNIWSLWQALKEAVTFSSEPYDDAAPNVEEMPISPEAEVGTIADSLSATAGLDDVRGEVVLVEGQIQQDGEPELAEQPLDGSDCSEAGSDALKAGSETLEAGSETLEAGSEGLEAVSEALEVVSEALDTVNKALEAGSEALEAGSEVLGAGSEALESGSEALESGSEALESGSEALESGSEATETGGGSGESIASVLIIPSLDGEDVRIDYENVNTDTSSMTISADSSGAGVGEKEALVLGVGDLGDREVVVKSDTKDDDDGGDSSEGSDGSEGKCSDGSKGRVGPPADNEASAGHEKDRQEQKTGNRIWSWLR